MDTQNKTKHSQAEIQSCISMLEHLANHTIDLAQLPEAQRVALMCVAGQRRSRSPDISNIAP